jgi:hypothetical protein
MAAYQVLLEIELPPHPRDLLEQLDIVGVHTVYIYIYIYCVSFHFQTMIASV